MRNSFFHRMWALAVVVSVGGMAAAAMDERDGVDDPIAELKSLGVPVEYGGAEHPREVKNANQITFVRFGHHAKASKLPERAIAILAELPNLRELSFQRVSFPAAWLLKLKDSQWSRWLERLTIHNVPHAFSDPQDLDFLAAFPRLQSLRLSGCKLTDDYLEKLLVLRNLNKLQLQENQITEAGLATLMKLESLWHLELQANCIGGSMVDVQRYAAKLSHFNIENNPVDSQMVTLDDLKRAAVHPQPNPRAAYKTDASLADIAGILPGPVTGVFSRWHGIQLSGSDPEGKRFTLNLKFFLDDAKLRDVGTFSQLRSLHVRREGWDSRPLDITDQGLAHLAGLAHLEVLRIFTGHTLTSRSLAPLATMPALRILEFGPFDLDSNGLRWLRSTPELAELTLSTGRLEGAALADINHAESLRKLHLRDVRMTLPPEGAKIGNVTHMTVESGTLGVEQCAVIGRFRALSSLTLCGPVTDAHIAHLATLDQLEYLALTKWQYSNADPPSVTPVGLWHLRNIKTLDFIVCTRSLSWQDQQAMADQFGWGFWGCSSGCCDLTPSAVQLTVDDLRGSLPKAVDREKIQGSAITIRGPLQRDRLILREQDMPPGAKRLYLTDCAIGELHFEGWMPPEIEFWGRSHVRRITTSGVPESARSKWSYRYLQDVRQLVVPLSPHLSSLLVADCADLESLRLEGFYPNLNQLQVRNLDRLKYLAAPYTGDAPRMNFESGFRQIAGLPSLRLFKMPGAALTDASFGEPPSGWPPTELYEVDVRDTEVSNEWLKRLATIPTLRIVRIGECWKISEQSKSAFRQKRPDIQLDEQTLHRPLDSQSAPRGSSPTWAIHWRVHSTASSPTSTFGVARKIMPWMRPAFNQP